MKDFHDGLAAASIGGKPDEHGNTVGGKWGFIDKTGKWVTNPQFDAVTDFKDGLAAASIGGEPGEDGIIGDKWGVINKKGQWVANQVLDFAPKLLTDL